MQEFETLPKKVDLDFAHQIITTRDKKRKKMRRVAKGRHQQHTGRRGEKKKKRRVLGIGGQNKRDRGKMSHLRQTWGWA